MDEADWRQILLDFRWSGTARGHWIARFGPQKLVSLCLRLIGGVATNSRSSGRAQRNQIELARDLVVFLEENFWRLTHLEQEEGGGLDLNQQRNITFAICQTLNAIIVSDQSSSTKREFLQLKCQAVSSLTVILITCNAHRHYSKLLSSFARLLLSIIARVKSVADRKLRLVACESLMLLEEEYPDVTFVVPKHMLSHCEAEVTHALQGYLCLLATCVSKLIRKLSSQKESEIQEASETLSYHSNEVRQAAFLLLDKLEVLSPTAVMAIARDFLLVSSAAKIAQQDLWHSFYNMLHMLNPLLLSKVFHLCADQAEYAATREEVLDVTNALVRRACNFGLGSFQVNQLLGAALANLERMNPGGQGGDGATLEKALTDFAEALLPALEDGTQAVASKVYALLKLCQMTETCEGGDSGEGQFARLSKHFETFFHEIHQRKRSVKLVKPLFSAVKDYLNGKQGSLSVRLASKIMDLCFDKHPELLASSLDSHLAAVLEGDSEAAHHQDFFEAILGFFSKWSPSDFRFVAKDMALVGHYFPCMDKVLSVSTVSPDLLLSVLLYYARCCIPQGDNWAVLETVLSLVRAVLKHHATTIHDTREVLNEVLKTVKSLASDPDTVDQCLLYIGLVNSYDVTKLSLLMFDNDVKVNSKITLLKPKEVKRNLSAQLGSACSGGLAVQDATITDFHIRMTLSRDDDDDEDEEGEQRTAGLQTMVCEIVFGDEASHVEYFALELSFEARGSGDVRVAGQPILVPLVAHGVTFEAQMEVIRPLPLSLSPKVSCTDAHGKSFSGSLGPVHLRIEHFCVPRWRPHTEAPLRAPSCSAPFLLNKTLRGAKAAPGRLEIALPPKFNILVDIIPSAEGAYTGQISTDFWPCLEFIDDYLETIFSS